LVAATHVPLGIEVLKRGIIFIDLATAQIAGLGAVAATVYLGDPHGLKDMIIVNAFAFGAAVLSGAFFSWSERNLQRYQEAMIGCSFVLAASMALLILANQPLGSEEIKDLLAGQVLFVDWTRIAIIAALYLPILVVWFNWREKLGRFGFYLIFAIVVTTSVQVVGVYLVFATLIFPALGAQVVTMERRLGIAYGFSVVGVFLGLIASMLLDYPTGPALVWSLAITALVGSLGLWKMRKGRVTP
jgi:zinc/manganese transport system permease protein